MCVELATDGCLIERLDAKAEVIEVSTFLRWWGTTRFAELTVHRHEIDQRTPRAKLNQPDGVLASFNRAPEHFAVEANHAIEVDHAQYKVVNLTDANHRTPFKHLQLTVFPSNPTIQVISIMGGSQSGKLLDNACLPNTS